MEPEEKVDILLVDDRPENLIALESILTDPGQNLVKAHSGEGALRCLLNQDFAVILLDVQMPGMDGFETATLIRKRKRSEHTPIIFVTAISKEREHLSKGYSLGAVDYLTKPIIPEILKAKVRVFVELFRTTQALVHSEAALRHLNQTLEQQVEERTAELMVSRDYFDNIIKSMIDTLIVLDKEAKIQTVNPATCHLLGYTEEELIGQPASILFAEEEEEEEEVYRVFQFFREPEKAGVIQPQDTIRNRRLTYKTKDGRLIPMLFNASVIGDKTGNITGVVAGAKDITDLKLAEVEIRKEKTFSENIIATIPDSLLVLDKDLRIKKANRSFYKVFGAEREKAIGARITNILGDEDGRVSARLTRLLGTKDKDNIEYFELHYPSEKRGERIFSITARNIIFAEEEEEEELLVITDITERKQAEEARRKTEEHFREVIEDIFRFVPEGLLVFTDKVNLFKHNKAFRDIVQEYSGKLNYTEEELAETILKEVKNRIASGDRTEIRIPKKQE